MVTKLRPLWVREVTLYDFNYNCSNPIKCSKIYFSCCSHRYKTFNYNSTTFGLGEKFVELSSRNFRPMTADLSQNPIFKAVHTILGNIVFARIGLKFTIKNMGWSGLIQWELTLESAGDQLLGSLVTWLNNKSRLIIWPDIWFAKSFAFNAYVVFQNPKPLFMRSKARRETNKTP